MAELLLIFAIPGFIIGWTIGWVMEWWKERTNGA